jgi:hypothetical protein
MKFDGTHARWCIGSVIGTLLAAVGYAVYAITWPGGPRGGSWPGLSFGATAATLVIFAGLLGARKKTLLLRLGSITWWMRGHLWLGLVSVPMVLFHGAFALGGPLTTALMLLLAMVILSGLFGAVVQHVLPSMMTAEVADERTYEQLERMCWHRRRLAYELVAAACGESDDLQPEKSALEAQLGEPPKSPKAVQPAPGSADLKHWYREAVRSYLSAHSANGVLMARDMDAMLAVEDLRTRIDPSLHPALTVLAKLCSEHRAQLHQVRLHRWLHGWLLLHIPMSMALLVLMVVHAVTALYY